VEDYQLYCEGLSMKMLQYQKTKVNWSDQTKPKIENEWASFFRVVDENGHFMEKNIALRAGALLNVVKLENNTTFSF